MTMTLEDRIEKEYKEKLSKAKIIPATPGFFILEYLKNIDDKNDYTDLERIYKIPVIAWRILEDEDDPVPIGVERATNEPTAILLPDGRVIDMFGGYKSPVYWLESLSEIMEKSKCRE